eukprot:TRINITY_DN27674_c0_g1_i1.p1 TRINITY_DN27674_c0_g1~~TRINITY_DN27674_c0_g1_i1.p1  ORF type:complete len:199 (-),score=-22.48 TRINITY_DN27674_c0_g1_i1:156-752(-)
MKRYVQINLHEQIQIHTLKHDFNSMYQYIYTTQICLPFKKQLYICVYFGKGQQQFHQNILIIYLHNIIYNPVRHQDVRLHRFADRNQIKQIQFMNFCLIDTFGLFTQTIFKRNRLLKKARSRKEKSPTAFSILDLTNNNRKQSILSLPQINSTYNSNIKTFQKFYQHCQTGVLSLHRPVPLSHIRIHPKKQTKTYYIT